MVTWDTAVTGAAGAYLTAGELSQRGWVASLTWGNAPRTDVLAQRLDPPLVAAIQVKTRRTGDFQVGDKAEAPAQQGGNEWFVFVSLIGPGSRPVYYVVPRAHLSALVYVGDRLWLAAPGRGGRVRQETARRAVSDRDIDGYREAWELLDQPAEAAEARLPDWYFESEQRVLDDGRPLLKRSGA